ncbi:type III-B CRISPR module RAMP protein Cmr1 [Nitrosomonas sp.]|uniref:type III-B CRISPR module RAMP protein Cmr1 n=1 Tax=Nitrosomonas sp. TaxID=42353 RepID=UPI00208CDC69|nr:type III-B CRISPR module RAMP protein Cmr1 [Nitrosomonas sp.]GJL75016.1 MAG: hypothetical protein NMNS02_11220 [Nitrosomonas sp.]
MTKPEIIKATYRIVTPMFIGDAGQKTSSITASTIKGVLRFWWRALNWGRIRESCSDDETALKKLHEEEAELFGSSAYDNKERRKAGKQGVGQSKVLLRVKQPSNLSLCHDWPAAPRNRGTTPSSYIGVGLWETNINPQRKALPENQEFTLEIVCRQLCTSQREQLLQALKVIGLVGGLGGRARRGFGSISIESIDETTYKCDSVDEYTQLLKETLTDLKKPNKYPPFTAFSDKSLLATRCGGVGNARDCHAQIAAFYKQYREGLNRTDRKVFGLPIKNSEVTLPARRASPLFFHVHPLGKNAFIGLFLLLPACPYHNDSHTGSVDYSLIDQFFSTMNKVELK